MTEAPTNKVCMAMPVTTVLFGAPKGVHTDEDQDQDQGQDKQAAADAASSSSSSARKVSGVKYSDEDSETARALAMPDSSSIRTHANDVLFM